LSSRFASPPSPAQPALVAGGLGAGDPDPTNLFTPTRRLYQGHLEQSAAAERLDHRRHHVASSREHPADFREELVRIDQAFNEKFSVWGKFLNDTIPLPNPAGCSVVPLFPTAAPPTPTRRAAYTIHAVNILRPNLINDGGFNFTKSAILSTPEGLTAKVNNPDINPIEPFANTQGVFQPFLHGRNAPAGYGPYNDYNKNYAAFDKLTWIKGRHTLAFGFTLNRYNKTENAASQQEPSPSAIPGRLPEPAPSAILGEFPVGNVSTFTMPSTDITPSVWAWQNEAYVQGRFQGHPAAHGVHGVRWSYFGQPTDANNRMDNFDPSLYTASSAPAINPANGNYVTPIAVANPPVDGIIIGGKNRRSGM